MATVVATRPLPQVSSRKETVTPASSAPLSSINTSQRGTPAAIPHKHIPYCSPGPRPQLDRQQQQQQQLQQQGPQSQQQLNLSATSGCTLIPASHQQTSTLFPVSSVEYPLLKPSPAVGKDNTTTKGGQIKQQPIYGITASQLSTALEHAATQPLPAARQVFPWLHGLHAENHLQLAFFIARKRSLRKTPGCLRGLTVVKAGAAAAGGDLSHSKIKGAVSAEELLKTCNFLNDNDNQNLDPSSSSSSSSFIDIDPRDGFSVRNFQIQTCKLATVSDIVVYGDADTPKREVHALAEKLAAAQEAWQERMVLEGCLNSSATAKGGDEEEEGKEERMFNTFVLTDDYEYVETDHPDLIALDSEGCMTSKVMDFFHWERLEMYAMSAPTEISQNVYLGPTPDPTLSGSLAAYNATPSADGNGNGRIRGQKDDEITMRSESTFYDLLIEATDLAQVPDAKAFRQMERLLERKRRSSGGSSSSASGNGRDASRVAASIPQLEFPGSGAILPPSWSQAEVDGLMATCEWIYAQAHHTGDVAAATTGNNRTGVSTRQQQQQQKNPRHERRDSKLSLSATPPDNSISSRSKDADGDSFMTDATSSSSPSSSTSSSPTSTTHTTRTATPPSIQSTNDTTTTNTGRRILIHCADGYTESSLLALAYYMYAEGVAVHEAWLALHRERGRNFFAYASDVALLRAIQPRLLGSSPKRNQKVDQSSRDSQGISDEDLAMEDSAASGFGLAETLCPPSPEWLDRMDGSLPSRILPYMYLGNLGHANNPDLLRELGIGQILSVGEPVGWSDEVRRAWIAAGNGAATTTVTKDDDDGAGEGEEGSTEGQNLMFVDRVQDNGVDPLMGEFGRCLEFIESGRRKGTATLVHCRVGVSRSATICIAEVMNELGLPFPRAYCFVRARRLNVIIQPHLRFCYELLKWEEYQCQKRGKPLRRELEWATIAHEIAAMNRPYSKQ